MNGSTPQLESRWPRRWAVLLVCFLWLIMTVDLPALVTGGALSMYGGDVPLLNESALAEGQGVAIALVPFFQSLVAGFMILFLLLAACLVLFARDHRRSERRRLLHPGI